MHSHKHSLNMFITFININYGCRSKNGQDHLSYKNSLRNQLRRCNVPPNHRPTCSSISQQRCHPRAGHDSPMNKELAGLHIAKDNNTTRIHSLAKPTQLGLSGEQRISQANQVGFIRPARSWQRLHTKLVSSLKSCRNQHLSQPGF